MNNIEAFRKPPDNSTALQERQIVLQERQIQVLERIAAVLEHLTTDNYGRVKVK